MAGKKRVRTAKDKPTTLDYGESPLPQSPQEPAMSASIANDTTNATDAIDATAENSEAGDKKKKREVKKKRQTWSREAQVWLLEQMVNKVEPYSPDGLQKRMAQAFSGAANHFTAKQIAAKARSFAKQSNGSLAMPSKRVTGIGIHSSINRLMADKSKREQSNRATF